MSTLYHPAISVDIDRFSDAKLKREWVRAFKRPDGSLPTVAELRAECGRRRAAGLEFFPPCDHTTPTGECAGHERETPC